MNAVVVIPTYNEADNLEKLAALVFSHAPEVHILVVDDNSPDGTGAIADRLAAEHAGKIHVLHRTAKEGLGRAYIAGFQWALERGYEAMIEMDADFSHDPLYLASMLEAGEEADVVVGSRYLNGISVINWPLRRILLSWGANKYVRTVTRLPVNDCTSGYRLYRRRVLERVQLNSVKSNGYSFQVEMTFRAFIAGFQITEVPIIFVERRAGQSKMSKQVIWESMQIPLKLRLRERKMRQQLNPTGVVSAAR
ncbi:dolichyl-phosphate beta-D-mannosyltransferase [Capsulimonas corticalis]|uniref:Dolichyl-phosphate beta-D-mannosyltransferase n=1 Tax=Capsulimonas corticalis TaxID=2219043 RepID=A0A402CXI4_9BACT|nr:polyprenol monophosphomannose synthase [Capsulimonas corticalis]BDI32268.1 dolichyl-phosphate beta-D-mannosyltransferase [Capsulimonas corticalis]